MKSIPHHPLADQLPAMPDDQYEGLKADVAAHGLRDAIVCWQGKVLDGRARQRACLETGVRPRYRHGDFSDELQAWAFVASRNLARQHMKAETRFAAWLRQAEQSPAMREAMQKKKAECEGRMKSGRPGKGASFDAWLGRLAGASRSTAQRVLRVKAQAPPMFARIAGGELSAAKALRKLTEMNRIIFRQTGKFDVILADPAWQYNSSGTLPGDCTDMNPALHYETASLENILGMDVRSIAAKNAALFLWCPASFIEKALRVAEAWGFQFRTSWVWHKSGAGFGAGIGLGGWLMVQHELLFICSRGGIHPEVHVTPPSVLPGKVTAHSRKPPVFRQKIEEMFPSARKIELFAREKVAGWTAWGDGVDTL